MMLSDQYFPHLNRAREARFLRDLEHRRIAIERAAESPTPRPRRAAWLVQRARALSIVLTRAGRPNWSQEITGGAECTPQ